MKYEYEPSAAMLMVMRVASQRIAQAADQAGLKEYAKDAYKRSDELGRKIRTLLRKEGFERDCEIDMDMENLARKAHDSVVELGEYIAMHSHKVADFLSKQGDNSLREWQDANPTPIRPNRSKALP